MHIDLPSQILDPGAAVPSSDSNLSGQSNVVMVDCCLRLPEVVIKLYESVFCASPLNSLTKTGSMRSSYLDVGRRICGAACRSLGKSTGRAVLS